MALRPLISQKGAGKPRLGQAGPAAGMPRPCRTRGHWVTPPGRGDPARRRRRHRGPAVTRPESPSARVAEGETFPAGCLVDGACRSAPAPVHRPRCGNASPLRDRGHWVTHPGRGDPAPGGAGASRAYEYRAGSPSARVAEGETFPRRCLVTTQRLSVSTRACSSAPLRECLAPTAERWLSRTATLILVRVPPAPSRPVESLMALRLLMRRKARSGAPSVSPGPRGRF